MPTVEMSEERYERGAQMGEFDCRASVGLYREHDSSIKVVLPATSVTIVSNVSVLIAVIAVPKLEAELVKAILD